MSAGKRERNVGACRRFPRVYGAGLGAGGIARASIAGFVDAVEARTDLGLYLQTPVVVFDEDAPDYRRPECGKVANLGPALLGDVSRDVDWDLLHAALAAAGAGQLLELCQLWAGDGTGATPAHYDRNENFLAQIRGRKHVLLVGAAHVFDVPAPGVRRRPSEPRGRPGARRRSICTP